MQAILDTILAQTPTILIVLSILLGTMVIARRLRVVSQAGATRMGFPADIAALAGSVVFVVTLLVGASIAFAQGGWGTIASSFMAGLGLGGVVVALAIQDIAKSYTAGIMLLYATIDLPPLGDPASPANSGVGLTYLQVNWYDTGVPNVVTSVLASYRGFDTLGETAVVFTAGLAVALLLGFGERSLAETLRRSPQPETRPPSVPRDGDAT
jgi:multisubunit Na+/H+ antiporter MnhB subunit